MSDKLLAGFGKTIVAQWKFNGPHVSNNRRPARRGRAGERSDFFSILLWQGFELWPLWAGMVNESK
jgi:hypothetical protein